MNAAETAGASPGSPNGHERPAIPTMEPTNAAPSTETALPHTKPFIRIPELLVGENAFPTIDPNNPEALEAERVRRANFGIKAREAMDVRTKQQEAEWNAQRGVRTHLTPPKIDSPEKEPALGAVDSAVSAGAEDAGLSQLRDLTGQNQPLPDSANVRRVSRRALIGTAGSIVAFGALGLAKLTNNLPTLPRFSRPSRSSIQPDFKTNKASAANTETFKDTDWVVTPEGIEWHTDGWSIGTTIQSVTNYMEEVNDPNIQLHMSLEYPNIGVTNPSSFVIDSDTINNPTLENAGKSSDGSAVELYALPLTDNGIVNVRYLIRDAFDAENPITSIGYPVMLETMPLEGVAEENKRVLVEPALTGEAPSQTTLRAINDDVFSLDPLGIRGKVILPKRDMASQVIANGSDVAFVMTKKAAIDNPQLAQMNSYASLLKEAVIRKSDGSIHDQKEVDEVNRLVEAIETNAKYYEYTIGPIEKGLRHPKRDAQPNIFDVSIYKTEYDNTDNVEAGRNFKDINAVIESAIMTWKFGELPAFQSRFDALTTNPQKQYVAGITIGVLNLIEVLSKDKGGIRTVLPSHNQLRSLAEPYFSLTATPPDQA